MAPPTSAAEPHPVGTGLHTHAHTHKSAIRISSSYYYCMWYKLLVLLLHMRYKLLVLLLHMWYKLLVLPLWGAPTLYIRVLMLLYMRVLTF